MSDCRDDVNGSPTTAEPCFDKITVIGSCWIHVKYTDDKIKENEMVPGTGVEPAHPKTDTRPSTLRVYQFRHPGMSGCSTSDFYKVGQS